MSSHPPVTPEYMRDWGRFAHGSPLYQHLVEVVATSDQLMRVINRIVNRPPPNVLFAAVHYLLMSDPDQELAHFYLSLVENPLPPEKVDAAFTEFVLEHEEGIVEIGGTRYTQTNECRRCVALLPAIMLAPFAAFHLVDVGASAGLNLAIDRYAYDWSGLRWGSSPLVLQAELRGAEPRLRDIEVLSRTGLDLSPVDVTDPDQRMWLEALIWPEHADRRDRLRAALELTAGLPITFVEGDAVRTLEGVLSGLPKGEPAVVMNAFARIQFTTEQWDRLEEVVNEARRQRPIHRVSMEVLDRNDDAARLSVDDGTGEHMAGRAHPHGEWVEMYG